MQIALAAWHPGVRRPRRRCRFLTTWALPAGLRFRLREQRRV